MNSQSILKASAAAFAFVVWAPAVGVVPEGAADEPVAARVANDRVIVSWPGSAPVDVYVGDQPALDRQAMRLVSDDDTDGRHEYVHADDRRPYFLLHGKDGSVHRVAERVLALESGSNFRDVGGYETTDGRRVRWGLIYRSGAMPQLSDRDYEFLGQLGIRVLCDLRSVEERVLAPTRWERLPPAQYIAVDYPASEIFKGLAVGGSAAAQVNDAPRSPGSTGRNLYRKWPESLAPQFKEIFDALLAGEAPLAFNCSAGQDRTGVATALVLTALGVPRETIVTDYHLSTLHRRPEFERGDADLSQLADSNIVARFYLEAGKRGPDALKPRPLYDDSGRARLLATFDEIETRWGSVERYLEEVLDVDDADIQRLRTLYLE